MSQKNVNDIVLMVKYNFTFVLLTVPIKILQGIRSDQLEVIFNQFSIYYHNVSELTIFYLIRLIMIF